MRLALVQLNPTVGDVTGNATKVLNSVEAARQRGANLIVLPEMCIPGYPPRDLLLREGVVEACEEAVRCIAASISAPDEAVVVGYPRMAKRGRKPAHNSIAICRNGSVERIYDKRLFPGYDVFDEDRYFEPGTSNCVFEFMGNRIGVLVCEDLWQAHDVAGSDTIVPRTAKNPLVDTVGDSIDLLIVASASPFVIGKPARHAQYLAKVAREHGIHIVMVNQVGANDDLVFDGRSMMLAPDGQIVAHAAAFEDDIVITDIPARDIVDVVSPSAEADTWSALVLGVRDYVHKTGNSRAIVGLSGGIDSALTATIAAKALGPENVFGVMMPSRFSSTGSITDAESLAANLNLAQLYKVPIAHVHATIRETIPNIASGVTDENIQARVRGIILMAYSNAHPGSLVLATGNKSEMAAGYCTLYGDMCGALAVLGDVLKTQVYNLARWINSHADLCGFRLPPIPQATIDKPPSAELRPDQTDQDTLPPYEVLDEITRRYIDFEQSVDRIIRETGFDGDLVRRWTRTIDINEYKRMQAAIVLKVNPRTFGLGRPMPAAMNVDLAVKRQP